MTPHRHLGPAALVATIGAALALASGAAAMTSHAGWPPDEHLVMDKGPAGHTHVLKGVAGRHNYLLGGYGDDTIEGGAAGDVIWGDYHPSGESRQTAVIRAGNGPELHLRQRHLQLRLDRDQPQNRRPRARGRRGHALRKLASRWSTRATTRKPHWKFEGCRHISFYSVGY